MLIPELPEARVGYEAFVTDFANTRGAQGRQLITNSVQPPRCRCGVPRQSPLGGPGRRRASHPAYLAEPLIGCLSPRPLCFIGRSHRPLTFYWSAPDTWRGERSGSHLPLISSPRALIGESRGVLGPPIGYSAGRSLRLVGGRAAPRPPGRLSGAFGPESCRRSGVGGCRRSAARRRLAVSRLLPAGARGWPRLEGHAEPSDPAGAMPLAAAGGEPGGTAAPPAPGSA